MCHPVASYEKRGAMDGPDRRPECAPVAEPGDPVERRVGQRIRSRRRELGLTLVELAARADLSHPFLSQLERGLARPSMSSLHRIALGLEVTQDWLLAAVRPDTSGEPVVVQRSGEGLLVPHSGQGTARQLLGVPGEFVPTEFVDPPPEFEEFFTHAGAEFVYLARGALEVELGPGPDGAQPRLVALSEGDCIRYPGTVPHRWRRAAEVPTRVLMIHPG